jgi:hypothetical protein
MWDEILGIAGSSFFLGGVGLSCKVPVHFFFNVGLLLSG